MKKKSLALFLVLASLVALVGAVTQVNLATQVKGNLAVSHLNSGTNASATTFWRGDATWATPGGGGSSANCSLSVDTKGGIIGGYQNQTSAGATMFPFMHVSGVTSTRWHSPKTFMLLGVVGYIDTSMPAGSAKELHWGRRVLGGSTSSDAVNDAITFIMPGSAPGAYGQPNTLCTNFVQGQSIYAVNDVAGPTGSTLRGWAGDIRGTATQPFGVAASGAVIAGTTIKYVNVGSTGTGSTTESKAGVPQPVGITYDVLCVQTTSSQPGTGDLVATLRKNGTTSTAVTVTIAASSTAGMYCDTTHTVAFVAADWSTIKLDNQAATNSAGIDTITWSGTLAAPYTAMVVFPNMALATFTPSSTDYMPPYSGTGGGTDSTEQNVRGPMPRTGSATSFACFVDTAPTLNTTTVEVIKGGAGSGMTASIPTSTPNGTVVTGSGTVAFTALDNFDISYTNGAGVAPIVPACAFAFE